MATFKFTVTMELDEEMVNENNHIVSREHWATSCFDDLLGSSIVFFHLKIMDVMVSDDTTEIKDYLIASYRTDIERLTAMRKTTVVKEIK